MNSTSSNIETPLPQSANTSVKEAIRLYREQGEGSIYSGYRDVIKSLIQNGYDKPIRNDSYGDALFLTDLMLEHTEVEFCMVGGSGTDCFVNALKDSFRHMLIRLKKVAGLARLVVIRKPEETVVPCTQVLQLAEEFPDTLQFANGVSPVLQKHYVISDGKRARIEEPHQPITEDTDASAIKATVYFDNPLRATILEQEFDHVWKILRPS